VKAGGRTLGMLRLTITNTGRRALASTWQPCAAAPGCGLGVASNQISNLRQLGADISAPLSEV
jgi:hypothetical protein